MKRILFSLLKFALMGINLPSQGQGLSTASSTNTQVLTKKQQRKAQRELRRQAREFANRQAFLEALEAIKDRQWVLMATILHGPRGASIPVSDNTNFIQFKGNIVYVQLAFNGLTGRNGLGGITVEGTPSQVNTTVDKRGNITHSFYVNGSNLTAQVVVYLNAGSSLANATVYPMMNNRNLTFSGSLIPTSKAGIFRSGFISY